MEINLEFSLQEAKRNPSKTEMEAIVEIGIPEEVIEMVDTSPETERTVVNSNEENLESLFILHATYMGELMRWWYKMTLSHLQYR